MPNYKYTIVFTFTYTPCFILCILCCSSVQLTPEYSFHIICHSDQAYVTSGEISSLLWPGSDILRSMVSGAPDIICGMVSGAPDIICGMVSGAPDIICSMVSGAPDIICSMVSRASDTDVVCLVTPTIHVVCLVTPTIHVVWQVQCSVVPRHGEAIGGGGGHRNARCPSVRPSQSLLAW